MTQLLKENLREARVKALESAQILKHIQLQEEERERLRKAKITLALKEQQAEAKIEKWTDALETGQSPFTSNNNRVTTNKEIALPKEILYKIFEERCDAFSRYYFSPREEEGYEGIV